MIEPSITIVIADDHQIVRSALRVLLEAEDDLEVVDEAGDVPTALSKVHASRPRVLVLDLNMPGGPSIQAIPRIRQASPKTGIVVLTMQNDPKLAREALVAGAHGYVLKEATDDELVQAVRLAAEGRGFVSPELGERLAAEPPKPPNNLSGRELEVLKLITLGYTNGEIAGKLFLSVRTIESHRAQVQAKTGRSTRADLVVYAREHHLVD